MKKTLLSLLLLMGSLTAAAQVDNYAIRLSEGGNVNCGAMPELNGIDAYTIQFWMCADKWVNGATLIQRGEGLKVAMGAARTIVFTLGDATKTVNSSQITSGKWVQITLLCTGTKLSGFVNGVRVTYESGSFPLPEDSDSPFVIGGDTYEGRLDEIRIWNTALSSDFDMFVNNTLNKWVPQLFNLVAYYKADQEQCPNLVDYKSVFTHPTLNHHGIFSETGATREKVTDNAGLPYLMNGAYTDNSHFYYCGIDREKYLLSNDLIILGIDSYNTGHLAYTTANDHGTVTNCEYLKKFNNRVGVLQLNGEGSRLATTTTAFSPSSSGYTFETWIYLDEWTEGAYIFRRESSDGKKGFSISLGPADGKQIIVRVNGSKFVNKGKLEVGKWIHFGVTTYQSGSTANAFLFSYDNSWSFVNTSLSDESTNTTPSGMDGLIAYIGEGLKAKLDETAIWSRSFSGEELTAHKSSMPMPGLGTAVATALIRTGGAFYRYNNFSNLGYDSFSQDEWRRIMTSAYRGYRGYQVRISVRSHDGWQNTIADASKRKIFAADLAELSEGYDGVELDLEWMDGTQTNLGLLADEILKVLPEGKTLMISCHAYGAYKFPTDKIKNVDGFTFQQYGPQKTYFSYNNFTSSYNNFVNYGFPKDKIYLSYSTTTSGAYNESDTKVGVTIGVRNGLISGTYTPDFTSDIERGSYNGSYYYFMGPGQVYRRAKFCRENNLKGIFYWDMGNDINTSAPNSMAKYASYALNSNVDSLITEVEVNHPNGIIDLPAYATNEAKVTLSQEDGSVGASVPAGMSVRQVELYSTSGTRLTSVRGSRVGTSRLPAGVYILRVTLQDGTSQSLSFCKK